MTTTLQFRTALATTPADLAAVQRLRYSVFVQELGGQGDLVDHVNAQEVDRFDPHARHLMLRDLSRPADDQVVGVYRVMTTDDAARAGGFSSAAEYDLAPLIASGRTLLELGRSCVHPDYRGGTALFHLWQGLADLVADLRAEVLFGVASFHGTDPAPHAPALSLLHHLYRAPDHLRPVARDGGRCDMARLPLATLDRKAALAALPPLIKAYLRIGGQVGDGAWRDDAFNTLDVCMIVDVAAMPDWSRARYTRGGAA